MDNRYCVRFAGIMIIAAQLLQGNPVFAMQADSPNGSSTAKAYRSSQDWEKKAACDELVASADRKRREGNYKEASTLFRKAIEEYKDSPRSALPLTETLMDQRRYDEAIDVYRTLVYKYPDKKWDCSRGRDIDTVMRFAFALSVTGNKGEAWDVFQANVTNIPDEMRTVLTPYIKGLQDREHYNAITLQAVTLTVFGYTYPGKEVLTDGARSSREDKEQDTITAFKLALKYSPRFAPARYYLAGKLQKSGDTSQAEQEWEKAAQYANSPDLKALIRERHID